MYLQANSVEIEKPMHSKLIEHSMTTPTPVLSPNSILRPLWSHCAFIPARKLSARISKMFSCWCLYCESTESNICSYATGREICWIKTSYLALQKTLFVRKSEKPAIFVLNVMWDHFYLLHV